MTLLEFGSVISHSFSTRATVAVRCRRILAAVAFLVGVGLLPAITHAAITVTGNVTPNPPGANQSVQIGGPGQFPPQPGTLQIDGGSSLNSGQVDIGFGFAEVTGLGTMWSMNDADVGTFAVGRLDVRDRAFVGVNGNLRIGGDEGSGTVVVQDPGTILTVQNQLNLGESGSALLKIADEAVVDATNGNVTLGQASRLELRGGSIRINGLFNGGLVTGSGQVFMPFGGPLNNNGRIEAYAGDLLSLGEAEGGTMTNMGLIAADDAEIEIMRVDNENGGPGIRGQITLRDGTIRFEASGGQPALTNHALVAATGGVNDIYGSVTNSFGGDIAVTNNSVLIFHDDVDAQDGVISVFSGSTAVFLQDLNVQAQATLLAELAGTDDDNGFGTAEVVGEAMLSGSLQVMLSAGYTPQAGDSFQLLSAGGGISGSFSLGDVPALPGGLGWGLDVGANHVVLNVLAPVLDGDYNGDGTVDAADYTVWRDLLGQVGEGLAADGTGLAGVPDGVVNQLDYQFWVDNFGNTLGSGAGSTAGSALGESPGSNLAAVPEPSAWMLAVLGLAAVGGALGRRRLLHWSHAPAVGRENR